MPTVVRARLNFIPANRIPTAATMPSPSFRLTLLASFTLIAGILGAAAAGGWLSLERFSRMSRMAAGWHSA